jgi:hypothetical protein
MYYIACLIEVSPFLLAFVLGACWAQRDRGPILAMVTVLGGILTLIVARMVIPSPIALALIGIHDVAVVVSFLLMATLFIVGVYMCRSSAPDRETTDD